MRIKYSILAVIILLNLSCQPVEVRTRGWKEDLNLLKEELPRQHIDLFNTITKREYNSELNKISSEIQNLSDLEIAIKLRQLYAKVGDSHTQIKIGKYMIEEWDFSVNFRTPIYLWLKEGIFSIYPLHKSPVSKINGYPLGQIIDSLSTLNTIDNQSVLKQGIPNYLSNVVIMKYFGFIDKNDPQYNIEDINGTLFYESQTVNNYSENLDSIYSNMGLTRDSIPFTHISQTPKFFREIYFEDSRIYYVQYNRCWSKELEEKYGNPKKSFKMSSFADFENRVLQTIASKNIDKFIFDIRYNKGGSSPQGTELIKKLAEIEKINKLGKLYVLIGRDTYSSAILNAMDFKRLTEAIFVGEATGGSPNHYGEVRSLQLPYSKLKVHYSTKYFKRTENDGSTLIPDILIEQSIEDYQKGRDPVFDWVIERD